jgi:hypothetical protein
MELAAPPGLGYADGSGAALDAAALVEAASGVRSCPKASVVELRAAWRDHMRAAAAVIARPGSPETDLQAVQVR